MKNNIFVNTIPHSGTHLVTALLDQMGYTHTQLFNRLYTKKPFFRRWQRAGINWRTSTALGNYARYFSKDEVPVSVASPRMAKSGVVANLLSAAQDGEYIIGHMPYSEEGNKLIQKYISKTITIIRDPRDMALSMLSHTRERPSHMAYMYLYSQLKTDNERLTAVVNGYDNKFGRLVGLEAMYRSMLSWGNQSGNILLKFEDLVGEQGGGDNAVQYDVVTRVLNHLELAGQMSDEKILSMGSESFGKTTTFRKGQIGKWTDLLDERDKALFKDAVNNLLVELNYEVDSDW